MKEGKIRKFDDKEQRTENNQTVQRLRPLYPLWILEGAGQYNDITGKTKFAETVSRFERLQNSPIPYLTRLLNINNV